MSLFFRTILSIGFCSFLLFAHMQKQNQLTELRLKVPIIAKKVQKLKEELTRLTFEKEQYENPLRLMELSRKPEFGYLKQPKLSDVVTLQIPKIVDEDLFDEEDCK